MKNWKRLLALFLSGAMALSLCACGSADADPSADVTGDPSAGVSADPDASADPEIVADLSQGPLEFSAGMSADDVALTVNGTDVPADYFLYWLNYNCYYFMSYYGMFGLSIADYADQLVDDTVAFCINETVLRQKAAELGVLPTDDQIKAANDSLSEDTRALLQSAYGLSEDSIDKLVSSDPYYENVLNATTHEPDAQELDEYLDAQGVFAVKHILLKTTDDSNQPLDDAAKAEKKALADDLLAQLQAADDLSAKFQELMLANSDDNPQNNPDGYVFSAADSLVDGFREATLALEVGGLSGVVETDYGYHIMLRLPLTDETKAEYKESFRTDALNDLVGQWTEAAETVRSDALGTLDAADFFNRSMAYQQALSERDAAESAPVEGDTAG